MDLTAEERRLRDARTNPGWRLWGPYLSERQWGTVREDYSETGDAWDYYQYYGDAFTIGCPTGSGNEMTLFEVSKELARRLIAIFLRDEDGRRPVYGGTEVFQNDPHWRDHLLFYEYFHGDNGAGLGASHQTGWTGLVARLIQLSSSLTAEEILHGGRRPLSRPYRRLTGAPIGDVATARASRGAPR